MGPEDVPVPWIIMVHNIIMLSREFTSSHWAKDRTNRLCCVLVIEFWFGLYVYLYSHLSLKCAFS